MDTPTVLFRLKKGTRQLVCHLLGHPSGYEVQLDDDLGPLRQQIVNSEEELRELLSRWRKRAQMNGWTVLPGVDED